jgi:hypothetical protein
MSARTPVLWNAQTGKVVPLKDIGQAPAGTWWLRRRLTLPVSSHPLFLTIPVRIGRQVLGSEKQRRTVIINSSALPLGFIDILRSYAEREIERSTLPRGT